MSFGGAFVKGSKPSKVDYGLESVELTKLLLLLMSREGLSGSDATSQVMAVYNRVEATLAMRDRLPEKERYSFGDPGELNVPMPCSRFEVE